MDAARKQVHTYAIYQLFSSHSCQVHPLVGLEITLIVVLHINEKLACPAFFK